jgi:hypothetical protein
MHRFIPLLALALLPACSSTTTTDSGTDATDTTSASDVTDVTTADTASDTAITDSNLLDVPTDTPSDSPPPDAGCSFDDTYTYGYEGGFVAFTEASTIAPRDAWSRTRTPGTGPAIMCMQTVPCGTSGRLDVNTVMAAILNQDVQRALAMSTAPLYGTDPRPVDGAVFVVHRMSDGHSFMVGGDCGGTAGCTPTPPGVSSLVTMLQNLDMQELALPGCEALR